MCEDSSGDILLYTELPAGGGIWDCGPRCCFRADETTSVQRMVKKGMWPSVRILRKAELVA